MYIKSPMENGKKLLSWTLSCTIMDTKYHNL